MMMRGMSDMTRVQAKEFIEAVEALRDGATDALASMAVGAYPAMSYNGELIKAGARINWNGGIKRAAVDLYDTELNDPENAPALWEDIEYREGYRIIPETITAGTAFAKDECGWWGDVLYRSLIDANVYTPEQYAAGWEAVT